MKMCIILIGPKYITKIHCEINKKAKTKLHSSICYTSHFYFSRKQLFQTAGMTQFVLMPFLLLSFPLPFIALSKVYHHPPCTFLSGVYLRWKDLYGSPFLQIEQTQFSHPSLTGKMLHFLNSFDCSFMESHQYIHIFLVLESPGLNTSLQVWPHHC